jgi:hypothetical protein
MTAQFECDISTNFDRIKADRDHWDKWRRSEKAKVKWAAKKDEAAKKAAAA